MALNAILFITLALINFSFAFDPPPLQDFCVADFTGKAPCKDPNMVTGDDFLFRDMNRARSSFNPYGIAASVASIATVPGFNTLGLTFLRLEILPNGFVPPHNHPRASEVVWVVEGVFEVGFITSYPNYKYYYKTLEKGDAFMIPVGLFHIVRNVARINSVMVAAFNSQSPGYDFMPDTIFRAKPAINSSYLARAFKLEEETVKDLQRVESWFGF